MKSRLWAIREPLYASFSMALVAYNLFSCLKTILGSVHPTDIGGKLSYYYLADELEGTYRGMIIALPPSEWQDFGQMSKGATVVSSSRLGTRGQARSLHFGSQKTQKEKAQTALRPSSSPCVHGSTSLPKKEVESFS